MKFESTDSNDSRQQTAASNNALMLLLRKKAAKSFSMPATQDIFEVLKVKRVNKQKLGNILNDTK